MISRVRTIEADDTNSLGSPGEDLVRYGYNGLSRLTHVTYPTPDLKLERHLSGLGQGYGGFDRFGRLRRQWWYTGSNTVKDRYDYDHDAVGNRLYRDNRLASGRDQFYGYDNLHRLTKMNRGNLSSGAIADAAANFNQAWTLDAVGNWSQFKWDSDGGAN